MNIETILTPEQVDTLLEGVLRASGSSLSNYTMRMGVDQMRGAIRAIEQAVLQSDRVQAWKRDAERLMFACEFDAYTTVSKDRYDYAIECAEEAGRDEPIKEDELNGLRRLIDAAIDHARRAKGEGE